MMTEQQDQNAVAAIVQVMKSQQDLHEHLISATTHRVKALYSVPLCIHILDTGNTEAAGEIAETIAASIRESLKYSAKAIDAAESTAEHCEATILALSTTAKIDDVVTFLQETANNMRSLAKEKQQEALSLLDQADNLTCQLYNITPPLG